MVSPNEGLLKEAQHRWFKADELCEIFVNYERLDILISQPRIRPPSGSFFAIKLHRVGEFKKDGHNWTKKKDGKTVQEAHEMLKVKKVKMLQCLYARGQDNKNFRRRIYWILDREASDIALFHYREAKGKRENCERSKKTEENPSISIADDGGFKLPMPYAELEDTYPYFQQDTYLYSWQEIEEAFDLPDPGAPGSPSALQEMYDHIENEDRSIDITCENLLWNQFH